MATLNTNEINKLKQLSTENFHKAQDEMSEILNTLIEESNTLLKQFTSARQEVYQYDDIISFAQYLLTFDEHMTETIKNFKELPAYLEGGIEAWI